MVGQLGVAPDYFLDSMSNFEADSLLEAYIFRYKDGWEQTREVCHYIALGAGVTTKEFFKMMPFSWDVEGTDCKSAPALDKEGIERLKRRAKEIELKLNERNGR